MILSAYSHFELRNLAWPVQGGYIEVISDFIARSIHSIQPEMVSNSFFLPGNMGEMWEKSR